MGRQLGIDFEPILVDFGGQLGMEIEPKSIKKGIEKTMKKRRAPRWQKSRNENFKAQYVASGETESTETLCRRQGFRFIPMVIEAHSGGWSKSARQTLDLVAKHVSACNNDEAEVASLSIAQRLSTTLHRESARAVLRRLQDAMAYDETTERVSMDLPPLWD